MATSPTMEPSVAAAITPPLEAGERTTLHHTSVMSSHRGWLCVAVLRTGDDLQVNGAAVRAGGVAGPADVLP